MSILSEYTGDESYGLEEVFERLLEGQRPNGSFHPRNNIYSIYGNKGGLRGLVAYYRRTGDERALAAAGSPPLCSLISEKIPRSRRPQLKQRVTRFAERTRLRPAASRKKDAA